MSNKKGKTQEQLFNRILINIGIAILAYILLYILYAKFYMMPALLVAVIFFVLAVAGYIISTLKVTKCNVKNYAHMFLAFGICLLFTNLSRILGSIMGMEAFMNLHETSRLFKMLVNGRYEVIIISWLGAFYLLVMLIYNTVLINKAGNKR